MGRFIDRLRRPTKDNTANEFMNQVVGNKDDAVAAGAVTTTDTLVAYVKQIVTHALSEADVEAKIDVIDGYHDVPVKDAITDAVMRDVIGRKTDTAAVDAVSEAESLMAYIKQSVTAHIAAAASLVVIDEFHDVPALDNTLNAQINEVIGNKTDTAVGTSGADKTLVGYVKGIVTDTAVIGALGAGLTDLGGMSTAMKAQVELECTEALAADALDHLCELDGATQPYPENVVADSIIAKMIAKGDPATPSTYNCTTDSLEAIRDRMDTLIGTLVNTGGTATIAAILGDFANVTLLTKLLNIQNQANRTTAAKNVASITTANLFTVGTGAVRLLGIAGHITTALEAVANATKLVYTSTDGAAVDLCATLDVNAAAIRKLLTITGTKATVMALSADEGVIVGNLATPLILTPGIISLNCAATTTGVIDWYVLYEPLAPGANIVVV